MACAKTTIVNKAKTYLGCKQGDSKHKDIVNTFNTISPLPDGYKMTYTAPWCACFVSAMAKKCGATDIIPCSYNCGTMLNKAKKMGIWVENDAYTPKTGDLILYDWNDSGIGDNIGSPDHVGIVESVSNGVITVIEGNYSTFKTCARRTIRVNGKYIRGFITPKYKTDSGSSSSSSGASGKIGITTSALNVRRGAGTKYGIIGVLSKNSSITILNDYNNSKWYHISYGSTKGYVCSDYVKVASTAIGNHYTGTYPSETLKKGSRGEQVTRVQAYINWYFGKRCLSTDGIFGDTTESYVKQLQKAFKQSQDGVVGPTTIANMKKTTK